MECLQSAGKVLHENILSLIGDEEVISLSHCERGEGVQGVFTPSLFCSGAAQVCHDDRVVELKEQLEVEEEDGERQEEKVEVESGETSQRSAPMNMTVDDNECAQNLSQECEV